MYTRILRLRCMVKVQHLPLSIYNSSRDCSVSLLFVSPFLGERHKNHICQDSTAQNTGKAEVDHFTNIHHRGRRQATVTGLASTPNMMALGWPRPVLFVLLALATTSATAMRNIMYLTGYGHSPSAVETVDSQPSDSES